MTKTFPGNSLSYITHITLIPSKAPQQSDIIVTATKKGFIVDPSVRFETSLKQPIDVNTEKTGPYLTLQIPHLILALAINTLVIVQ